jgi:hypothetical protein
MADPSAAQPTGHAAMPQLASLPSALKEHFLGLWLRHEERAAPKPSECHPRRKQTQFRFLAHLFRPRRRLHA